MTLSLPWSPRRRAASYLAAAVLAAAAVPARAALPPGFTESTVASGLGNPTLLAIAPDGRVFVSQQSGRLRVIKDGALLSTPFLTLSVNSTGERGLLGVAFDPAFEDNRFVYVYYTTNSGGAHNRVSRFRASASNPDVAEAGSEQVLLNLPNLGSSNFHNGGALQFGADGKLYISVGENNQPNRAQDLNDLFGKVLRINPDGSVPPDNPNGRVWARGFRNPFTMAVQPGTGRIFVNDVGERAGTDREEVNLLARAGNYQWPQNRSGAGSFFSYASGCAITGGDFYNPQTQQFPASFVGRFFFGDYCGGWIRHIASSGSPGSPQDFLTGLGRNSIVDVQVHPDGSLYYAIRTSGGVVRRVRFTSGLRITQQPQDLTVTVGQTATFTVAATGGTGTLRYQWSKNGADVAGATSPTFSFTAQVDDNNARVRVVVRDNVTSVTSDEARLTVSMGGQPTCTVFDPRAGSVYAGGDTIAFSGTCTDPEDGTLPASAFLWNVRFHHFDPPAHDHPFNIFTGVRNGSFEVPQSGEVSSNVFFRIHLTARDSDNQESADVFRDVLPRKAVVTLRTDPPGRLIELDGQSRPSPVTFTGVVGIFRPIGTSSPQGSCQFASWSDGGAIDHEIATPETDTVYTASFTGCPAHTYVWPEAESGAVSAPMQKVNDAGASGGQFIQVAAGNNSQAAPPTTGHSVISFNVPSAGTYKVWGRVMVATNADDSFWVRMDGGTWTNWNNIPIGTSWHWDDVHNGAAGNAPVNYTLSAGTHTLTVAYREDGTRLDRVLITDDPAFVPTGPGPGSQNVYLWSEAEDAVLTVPMDNATDADASGGEYVTVGAGNNSQAAPPASGHATFSFEVNEGGTYKVWGRLIAATNGDDSFWVRVDGGAWISWNNIPIGGSWHWDDVHNAAAGNAVATFSLAPGSHTLTIAYREDGARLDKVLVTNDLSFTPTGLGQ